MNTGKTYCGFIAIVGYSNVGKSTLLNKLLGHKISITSHRIQTTRHYITGVHTEGEYQTIYIDTPGLHMINKCHAISSVIDKVTSDFIASVDLIIFVVEGTSWKTGNEIILNKLRKEKVPVILVINKIDKVQRKTKLLPYLRFLENRMKFLGIVPISAKTGMNISNLSKLIHKHLPEAMHHFPKNYITNSSQFFVASEIIREKLMRFLGAELPYLTTVKIERFVVDQYNGYNISGLIFVKRESQKKIVIGKKGIKIKTIGTEARKTMQKIFDKQVYVKLWVKVKPDLINNDYILHNNLS